jgi:hypothetical protein
MRFPTLSHVGALALLLLTTLGSASAQSAGGAKFHVVLAGGPYKGTYDVTADACMAGVQKKGSWHATWETDNEQKGKLSAVLVGFDPTPTFGDGTSASLHFGPPDSQLLYEILKPAFNVVDRGNTATLTFKGEARTTSYEDGTQANGGSVEITVTCGKIIRGESI